MMEGLTGIFICVLLGGVFFVLGKSGGEVRLA